MKRWYWTVVLLLPVVAWGETLYVTERLTVSVFAAPAEGPAVRTVEAGAAVEILERADRFTRIRDRQGMEGWMDSRYLVAEAPSRARLQRAVDDAGNLRRDLTETQGKLKKAEAERDQQLARNEALARQLASAGATAPASAPPPAPTTATATSAPVVGERNASIWTMDFSLSWLLLSFAMLGSGFTGGVVWVRESIRRRSGGMYLRV